MVTLNTLNKNQVTKTVVLITVAAICLAGLLVYSNTFHSPFHLDYLL